MATDDDQNQGLAALYQQVVLEHARSPRHAGTLEGDGVRVARGDNPLCGDAVTLYVVLEAGDAIAQVRHETRGCAICRAAASVLSEGVAGGSVVRARQGIALQRGLVSGRVVPDAQAHGAQAAFAGVAAYPARHRCALLAWRALEAALDGVRETVTTE